MNRPVVSILTPSLNQGRFLVDCLASVASQTYADVEHVVSDGGSTDGTVELLAAAGPEVTWWSEPDGGQAHAVNKAFAASTGDIIGWINSDDALFATDTVERVVSAFSRRPELVAVYGDMAIVSEDGRILRHFRSRWPRGRRLRKGSSPVSQPTLFLRRSAIGDGPLLREDLHLTFDFELILRLARRRVAVEHEGSVLAVDRDHGLRKLRMFAADLDSELEALAAEFDFVLTDDAQDRLAAFARRLTGLRAVCTWSGHDFAGPWRVDALVARVMRQISTSHRRVVDAAAAAPGASPDPLTSPAHAEDPRVRRRR